MGRRGSAEEGKHIVIGVLKIPQCMFEEAHMLHGGDRYVSGEAEGCECDVEQGIFCKRTNVTNEKLKRKIFFRAN